MATRRRRTARIAHYTAIFEPDPKRGYTVTIPVLPGCISEGETFEEAMENIQEAATLYLSVLLERRSRVPREHRRAVTAPVAVSYR